MDAIAWDWTAAEAVERKRRGQPDGRRAVSRRELIDRVDGGAVADAADAFGCGTPHPSAPVGQMRLEIGEIVGRPDARQRQRQPVHVAVARARNQIADLRKGAVFAHQAQRFDGKLAHGLARVVHRHEQPISGVALAQPAEHPRRRGPNHGIVVVQFIGERPQLVWRQAALRR